MFCKTVHARLVVREGPKRLLGWNEFSSVCAWERAMENKRPGFGSTASRNVENNRQKGGGRPIMLGQLRVGTTWPGEKCNQPAGTTGLVAPVAWPWLSGCTQLDDKGKKGRKRWATRYGNAYGRLEAGERERRVAVMSGGPTEWSGVGLESWATRSSCLGRSGAGSEGRGTGSEGRGAVLVACLLMIGLEGGHVSRTAGWVHSGAPPQPGQQQPPRRLQAGRPGSS